MDCLLRLTKGDTKVRQKTKSAEANEKEVQCGGVDHVLSIDAHLTYGPTTVALENAWWLFVIVQAGGGVETISDAVPALDIGA